MKQKKIFIIATVLFILIVGLYYSVSYQAEGEAEFFSVEDSSLENPKELNKEKEDKTDKVLQERLQEEKICVYICGHIKKEGVYYLSENSRVADVVELAGGFKKSAKKEQINLAEKVTDGEQIYIPSKKEVDSANKQTESVVEKEIGTTANTQKINLNEADESVLMTLQGIGKSKAEAIIKYREEHGAFHQIEEIKQIEGIKDGVFQKIKDFITI